MKAKKFYRTKPHVNIGTIGHVDHHGKTYPTAITKASETRGLQGRLYRLRTSDKAPEERQRGINYISVAHVEYETLGAPLRHADRPGHADYIKNMISGSPMDGATRY